MSRFFKKYGEETHRKCMAKVYHVHLKKGDACVKYSMLSHQENHKILTYLLFKKSGEIGGTFWITLKGKVAIMIPSEKEVAEKDGKSHKEKVPAKVDFQGAGYAFGELALLERKPR